MNKEVCDICGRELKNFIHNCSGSSNMPEIYGCPMCDDKCPLCFVGRTLIERR